MHEGPGLLQMIVLSVLAITSFVLLAWQATHTFEKRPAEPEVRTVRKGNVIYIKRKVG